MLASSPSISVVAAASGGIGAAVLLDEAVLGPELVDQGYLVGGLCEPGREADKRGRDHGFDGVLH